MPKINFRCEACRKMFYGDVGKITFPKNVYKDRPRFEKEIICPNCGVVTLGEGVVLTEIGKYQLADML